MNPEHYELAIVIINYKTPHLVIDCIDSVIPEIKNLNAKIIIVDNYSNDNSCDEIQKWVDNNKVQNQIKLISSSNNGGFSDGNNIGIKDVKADFYLLLNSDTVVRQGAIATLLNVAKSDDTLGLITPRLEWPDGTPQKSCFKFHTPISELISSARTGPITKIFNRYNVPQPVSDQQGYYEWSSFACVLVRSEVFDDIGLMDDGYFMYYEDVAFCFHAKKVGWKILNEPNAHVVHLRGGSSTVKSQAKQHKRLPRYFYESRTRYFHQAHGHVGLLLANILWTLGWGISSARGLFSASYQSDVSVHQWLDIWTNFINPLKAYINPENYDKT